MKKLLGFIVLCLLFSSNAYSIEVTSLEAEKKLEFSELFPKSICNKIYDESFFGVENKLEEEVTLKQFVNLKRINLDETNSVLRLFFDQRSFFYTEPKLNLIIFNNLADDFSDQIQSISKKIKDAGTKKIVVCEYDLKESIKQGKFFDFQMTFQNSITVSSNIDPKILIYYDGTIEYLYYDEEVSYDISDFNYKDYPFDTQKFKFVIYSKIYENLEFRMSDKFKVLNDEMREVNFTNISSPGWTINQFISYPYMETLVDAYSDYAKHSITTEFLIQRNSSSFVYKFITPVLILMVINYLILFLPSEYNKPSTSITLFFLILIFNLVTTNSSIPQMPYLNIIDWFIFTALLNSFLVIFICFIEAFYIGHFMGFSLNEIVKVPKNEKTTLLRFRLFSKIFVPLTIAVSAISGYYIISF